jgi:hypothetical protein
VKRLVAVLLILPLVFVSQYAGAVTKPVAAKEMVAINLATPISANTKMHILGSSIVLLNDSTIWAIGADGIEKWRLALTQGAASIATALMADSAGNMWVAGSSANVPAVAPNSIPTTAPINPDNVVVAPKVPTRSDLTVATVWKSFRCRAIAFNVFIRS